MLPFVILIGGWIGNWLESFFDLSNVQNMNSTPQNIGKFNISTFQPSDNILKFKGYIEGFQNKAYKDGKGVVTVGTGLTYFSDGSKPVFGATYSTDFLNKQLLFHSKEKINSAKKFMEGMPELTKLKLNQKIADVIYDIFFQGFSSTRQKGFKDALNISEKALANYLLSNMGVWGSNYWQPGNSGYTSRFGLLKRGYWRAYYVMGQEKTPQQCDAFINSYKQKKVGIPFFI